ncbi:carboxylesterase family protein [uncultured Desulfovibrio sp.]|uniref:carboxylesterase/lipase family protein n=1 Tax=uncultured Desulfovibrio sp. TaxID=167968 RepID=UPI002805520B|nr:carboxylesterase family protein [uncultured Desulfovibrio sp.]
MNYSRRSFIKGMAASVALPLLTGTSLSFAAPKAGPIIQTQKGKVQGMVVDGIHVFLGVPCGKPPYEPVRRLGLPEFVDPWSGVVPCTQKASLPLQGGGVIADGEEGQMAPDGKPLPGKNSRILVEGGGDCLRLNIWTPDPGKHVRCPVLVYIPGGGSMSCDNSEIDGTSFARSGVVVVTINYRVNVDGFMKIPGVPANLAIRDMLFATQWVKENIAAFGGDPDRITVMGQSAGATHIGSMLASPLGAGLFEQAILMSGSHLAQWTPEQADTASRILCDYWGIPYTKKAILALPYDKLLNFRRLLAEKGSDLEWARYTNGNTTLFKPYVDGTVLKKRVVDSVADGMGKNVSVMIGCTADEWRYVTAPTGEIDRLTQKDVQFILDGIKANKSLAEAYRKNGRGKTDGEIYTALQSDIIFRIPTNRLLEARAKGGGKTWAYSFEWKSDAYNGKMGAAHWCDIPFVFDMLADKKACGGYVGDNPPQSLADKMHKTWVNFITTGNPGWSQYDLKNRPTMKLNLEYALANDPWRKERELLTLP